MKWHIMRLKGTFDCVASVGFLVFWPFADLQQKIKSVSRKFEEKVKLPDQLSAVICNKINLSLSQHQS